MGVLMFATVHSERARGATVNPTADCEPDVNPCVNPLYQALYGVYKQKSSTVKGL